MAQLSGRKAQAARNDELILTAARAVFMADPGAPIAAVAERARVGHEHRPRRAEDQLVVSRRLCLATAQLSHASHCTGTDRSVRATI